MAVSDREDAEHVKRQLLGLVVCPHCGEEVPGKEVDISVPNITISNLCEKCKGRIKPGSRIIYIPKS